MDNEFRQTVTYAKITPYRNYSRLDSKDKTIAQTTTVSLDEIIGHNDPWPVSIKNCSHQLLFGSISLFEKSNLNFFHTVTPTHSSYLAGKPTKYEIIWLQYYGTHGIKDLEGGNVYYTTKDRHIRSHFNNPFSRIEIITSNRVIRRNGDKITIKKFNQTKSRSINCKYFKISQHSISITFDMVKGNFMVVTYNKGKKTQKKFSKCFRTNSFYDLERALISIINWNSFPSLVMTEEYYSANNRNFIDQISLFFNNMFLSGNDSFIYNFIDHWEKRFVTLKKIKTSDNFKHFLKYYYPTEVYLKKNDRKLVASSLDKLGIKSNLTIKIVHKYPNIPLGILMQLCGLFGKNYTKYIGNINDQFFIDLKTTIDERNIVLTLPPSRLHEIDLQISNTDKENVVHILNDVRGVNGDSVIHDIFDHFKMLNNLSKYYPNMGLTPRKYSTFHEEHARVSNLERNINRGYDIKLDFYPEIKKKIEEPIEIITNLEKGEKILTYMDAVMSTPKYLKRVFTPKLLTTSEEYSEEGGYMNHCVAGYIEYSSSIIVSLRCGETDRVTCEYGSKSRINKQSRYFNNTTPPEYFNPALDILNDRIKTIREEIKFDRVKTPMVINGIIVPPPTNIFNFGELLDMNELIPVAAEPF